MPQYLSAEWLDAAARRFDAVRLDPPAATPGVVVAVTVDRGTTTTEFSLVVDRHRLALVTGATAPSDRPEVRLHTTEDVARRIATGELSASRAFMAGTLRLGGDVTHLLDHREVLGAVSDVLADLRTSA